MGNYNPRSPLILGQEWVPIREENVQFSPSVNAVELGTAFTLLTAQRPRDARFYINTMQAPLEQFQCSAVNIYPYGTEDLTGPISEVIIPCNAVSTTGSNITGANAANLYQPGDGNYVEFDYNSGTIQQLATWYNISAYPVLANKRILNVTLLYAGYVYDLDPSTGLQIPFVNPNPQLLFTVVRQRNDIGNYQEFTGPVFGGNTGALDELSVAPTGPFGAASGNQVIGTLNLGDINNFWDPTGAPTSSSFTERQPWRYTDMLRLEQTFGAGRQHIWIGVQLPSTAYTIANSPTTIPRMFLDYLALRVTYCEERRVAYGAKRNVAYSFGMNAITLRDTSFNADPVLPAGDYLATLTWVNPGEVDYNQSISGGFPQINGLRELYQIPSHRALEVDIPFPLHDRLGETFTEQTTHILPQLTLHASGGTLTEPHVYGRQAVAQVWGSQSATQEIYDDLSGVAASYPQVRFYARRFGDTSVPLTLTGVGSLSGSTVSITAAELDALSEILDGWKEVTLRFASPPSMGTVAGFPAWVFTAAGEAAGNRYEVLGASAPAVSGFAGTLTNFVPSPNTLGPATYQPPTGAGVWLAWMPQGVGSPWVTGAGIDTSSDLALLFSQDPPTVTGFALTQQSQIVTGIGLGCNSSSPCCIPTGIGYQQLTWGATSLPTTGFGAFELQRWDSTTGGDFQTIMFCTDPTVLTFNDFESRVGVNSVYRMRTVNVLNFNGLWSTYVTGAPVSPGVYGGTCGGGEQNSALIFTSNASQAGAYNAAYVAQWENFPEETFSLPEGDSVIFQPRYGEDGSVAFHGTERELEQFSRTVQIQGAAISPPRLADCRTIRDLAWAQLPYVCVRNEIGDRWFANVRVPKVTVRNNRTIYMAALDIVETTQTPYPVDP